MTALEAMWLICGSSNLNPACDQATVSPVSLPGQEGDHEDKEKGCSGSPGLQVVVANTAVDKAGRCKVEGSIWPPARGHFGFGFTHFTRISNRAVQIGTRDQLEAEEVANLKAQKNSSQVWRLCQPQSRRQV